LTNGSNSDPESRDSFSRKNSDRKYELRRKNSPLTRLGVDVRELMAAPKISPILREIQGGKSKAIKAMRFSDSPLIQKFLEKYDSISVRDREKLNIEAIALASGVDIRHLWGEIMLAMREHSVSQVKVIAVTSHPDIIRKRVECALTIGGYRDRDAIDTMLGALPKSQGITIFNQIFPRKTGEDDPEEEPQPEVVDDLEYIFPDASVMQERVQSNRVLATHNSREPSELRKARKVGTETALSPGN
jgi:hypothetical protein